MTQALVPLSTVQREDDLLVQELDEEIIMANIDNGMYYGLGDVAREIWLLLEQPRPVADICTHLTERYEVDPATCEGDVLAFLNELVTEHVIRVADHG